MNTMIGDFDDSIEDLIGAPQRPLPKQPAPVAPMAERLYTENCTKCGGTGRWGYRQLTCFGCKGSGKLTFKTSFQDRAKAKDRAHQKKLDAQADFYSAHKDLVAWLRASADRNASRGGTFTFPQDMINAVVKYGSLTDSQLATCERLMAKDRERQATQQEERAQREASAPPADASKIAAAFAKARAAAAQDGEGIKFLRLRLDAFSFSPDRTNTTDVWVKDTATKAWLGKFEGGRFKRFRACTEEQEAAIIAVAADPAAAAKAYGLRTGECSCCGRELTNRVSIDRGIGPICAERYGF